MDAHVNPEGAGYSLPPSIVKFRDLARRIVREELIPLERAYMASSNHAYGLPPIICLRAVFDKKTVDRLVGISKESGLWEHMVPEEYGRLRVVHARTGGDPGGVYILSRALPGAGSRQHSL